MGEETKVQEYDKQHGVYKEPDPAKEGTPLLPTSQMPKAPDPSPFKMGPLAPGQR